MKRFFLFSLMALMCHILSAQDIIYKQTGDQIKAKITEISAETIKYKEFDFQDGPVRIINVKDVFMVIYQNGKREVFAPADNQNQKPVAKTETQVQKEEPKPVTQPQTPVQSEEPVKKYKGTYFMVGTGVGRSYGWPGVRAQLRLGGKFGFGLHGGIGYYPGGDGQTPVLASAGIKIFPYKGIYINPQFGLTGRKYVFSDYSYSEEKYLWGPSLLFGIDQVFGRKLGIGFNAGLGLTFNFYENEDQYSEFNSVSPTFDMAFIIRF